MRRRRNTAGKTQSPRALSPGELVTQGVVPPLQGPPDAGAPVQTPAAHTPAWPIVIGIVSLMVCLLVAPAGVLPGVGIFQLGRNVAGTEKTWFGYYAVAALVVAAALQTLLPVASIALLMLSRRAAKLMTIYAMGTMLNCVSALFMSLIAAGSSKGSDTFHVLMLGMTIVAVIYPTFLIVWFRRNNVHWQMATWPHQRGLRQKGTGVVFLTAVLAEQ